MARKSEPGSEGETPRPAGRRTNMGRRLLATLPFADSLAAAGFCLRDPATPFRVKAMAVAAFAYFLMPFDFIPDLLLLIGFADDAAVFWAVWRMLAKHITDAHRAQARSYLRGW